MNNYKMHNPMITGLKLQTYPVVHFVVYILLSILLNPLI